MVTITIPKKLERAKDLVVIPRKQYEELLSLKKVAKDFLSQERDTDIAIKVYQKEKKQKKLKVLKSLADLR